MMKANNNEGETTDIMNGAVALMFTQMSTKESSIVYIRWNIHEPLLENLTDNKNILLSLPEKTSHLLSLQSLS